MSLFYVTHYPTNTREDFPQVLTIWKVHVASGLTETKNKTLQFATGLQHTRETKNKMLQFATCLQSIAAQPQFFQDAEILIEG